MLNEGAAVAKERLEVIEGLKMDGRVNTTDDVLLAHIKSSIRRGHQQINRFPPNPDQVCLVGGGPSLESTLPELRQLIFEGAKLVTVNGAYHWCLERNLQPKTQIVMDARESNARFVTPAVPQCNYLLASQCHPATWDAVAGRPKVYIFHAAAGDDPGAKDVLDAYYGKQWYGIGGGTTVATRALWLLRTLGYLRFHLFGVDSCWMDGKHHAYDQPENAKDRRLPFKVEPVGRPDLARTFVCAPWHVKQAEDFLQEIRINGNNFLIQVHGNGLLNYIIASAAEAAVDLDDVKVEQVGGDLPEGTSSL
jgi:hypothetical protein